MKEFNNPDEELESKEDITTEETDDKYRLQALEQFQKYNNGEISKSEYSYFIIQMLEKHIKAKAKKRRRNVSGSHYIDSEDLAHDFVVVVLESIDSYDPNVANPFNYFENRFNNSSIHQLGPDIDDHRKNQITKFNRMAKAAHYEDGIYDKDMTIDALASITHESVYTCETVLNIVRGVNISYEEAVEKGYEPATNNSPESFYLNTEKNEFLMSELSKLNAFQIFLLQHTVLADDKRRKLMKDSYVSDWDEDEVKQITKEDMKWSLGEFVRYFEDPEHREPFTVWLPIDSKVDSRFIKKSINQTVHKLKYSAKKKSYIGYVESPFKINEQATDEEIERAFTKGLLDDIET